MTSGRKRAFDEEKALNAAMEIFWKKGYVGSSLTDLTQSMGINKPSMYSTFGNKETLFIKATQQYVESKMNASFSALFEANVPFKTRLKNHMIAVLNTQCSSDQQKGCYLVLCQAELVGGDIPEIAAKFLKELESVPVNQLTHIFTTDPEAIDLGLDTNAASNALSIYTVLKGTASMARSGVPFNDLESVIDNILNGIGLN